MEKGKKGIINKLEWAYMLATHGLFLHGVRNNLAKIGFDIMPYYYVVATKKRSSPQILSDSNLSLEFSVFDESEVKFIKTAISGIEHKDLLGDLKKGDRCIGLKCDNEIAAYLFIRRRSFYFRKRYFYLGEHDAYIHSTYVFDKYRGKNIAPFLKYRSFELLEKEGVIYGHSINECFNKPAIKMKKKFNAKKTSLNLSIVVFGKWTKNFILKKY